MNATEERLKDALGAVGETVRPGEVPPPRFARRRAPRAYRRFVPMAAAAAIAVAVGGGALAGGALDRGPDGAASPGGAPTPAPTVSAETKGATGAYITVFLCTDPTVVDRAACHGRGASAREKQFIEQRLRTMPIVERAVYESKQQAYERFKERFAGSPEFEESVKVGAVPDAFRVRVRAGESPEAVQRRLEGVPGIAEVVVEPGD
ncbi:permease-like cell division protein FtsX [Actinomadura sp. WMMB 499]|uniref:permease-like cell division protein FtsX n=1 Tax=Actinomadura sp. WMMB 499 TaxID=1219491 RepID=UPI001244FBA9|nr:permease-like cell division protein FtsX [Actinomadura sp. WMMB 499]QFG22553.1 hypothetical protein F7P10_16950 [Actinomadura sp. WMMB 499]